MVTYFVENKNTTIVVYKYYPENHMESKPGIITVDLVHKSITLDVAAEEDFLCRTSADELNEMRNAINEMRVENGEQPFSEEELPIAKNDEEWYQYAEHAIRRLREELEEGNTPNQGTVAWY
jgi:hypothetical protein